MHYVSDYVKGKHMKTVIRPNMQVEEMCINFHTDCLRTTSAYVLARKPVYRQG